MFDFHIRLNGNIKKYCAQAKQEGLTGLCFTEPIVFLPQHAKEYISSDGIELLSGAEIPYEPETHIFAAMSLSGVKYDYILNSVRTVDGISLERDEYYTLRSRDIAYSGYLEKVYESLDAAYDYSAIQLGHVSKFAYYPSPALLCREAPELIDSILMRLIFLGKALEVDASAISVLREPVPSKSILDRYRELGGELITVGSSAHVPMFTSLRQTYAMLKDCGFKYYSVFREMHPTMYKL